MSYLERQFLIAMPGMEDPNFTRGVTLLCQHNEDGALGITINRESGFRLGEVFDQLGLSCDDPAIAGQPVYIGGPVHPERGFVLHSNDRKWEATAQVGEGICISTSRDILEAIAAGEGPEKFIIALGYAGWGSGQLEDEIRHNAWLNVMATAEIIFDQPVAKRWEQAVARLGIDVDRLQPAGGHA